MTDKHNAVALADTVPQQTMMHPLVERMLEKNPTPEALEKILTLQREWQNDQRKQAYDSALVELKRALPPFLLRDKSVEYNGKVQYTHTTLAAAMETVTPMLIEHGFSLTWKPGNDAKGQVTVTCKLTHRLGHTEEATLAAGADNSGHKSGAQAVASTVTLLQRHTALALLGLATADMKDPAPESAPSVDKVDTSRNMRAMSDLAKHGKNKAEVEKFLGKPLNQWTSTDLDKLRAWIKPTEGQSTAAPQEEAPAVEMIGKAEIDSLKALRVKWKLTPDQMGAIITEAIGRHPASAAEIAKDEYVRIVKVFDGLASGAYNLRYGKIEMPPDIGAAVRPADMGGKTADQLNKEAKDQGILF